MNHELVRKYTYAEGRKSNDTRIVTDLRPQKGGCKQGKNTFMRNIINLMEELPTITTDLTEKKSRIV